MPGYVLLVHGHNWRTSFPCVNVWPIYRLNLKYTFQMNKPLSDPSCVHDWSSFLKLNWGAFCILVHATLKLRSVRLHSTPASKPLFEEKAAVHEIGIDRSFSDGFPKPWCFSAECPRMAGFYCWWFFLLETPSDAPLALIGWVFWSKGVFVNDIRSSRWSPRRRRRRRRTYYRQEILIILAIICKSYFSKIYQL